MNEFLEERVEEIVAAMKSNRYSHQVYIQLLEESLNQYFPPGMNVELIPRYATGLMDEIHYNRMEEL